MVISKMDNHEPRTKQTYETYGFHPLMGFGFYLICQILAKFSGVYPERTYLSWEKEKENFCVVFTYSIKRGRVKIKASLHRDGGPQIGKVTRFGEVTRLSI